MSDINDIISNLAIFRHNLVKLLEFGAEISSYGISDHSFYLILTQEKYLHRWLELERDDALSRCQKLLLETSNAYGTNLPMHITLFKRLLTNLTELISKLPLFLQKRYFEYVLKDVLTLYQENHEISLTEFENSKVYIVLSNYIGEPLFIQNFKIDDEKLIK